MAKNVTNDHGSKFKRVPAQVYKGGPPGLNWRQLKEKVDALQMTVGYVRLVSLVGATEICLEHEMTGFCFIHLIC
jgi:hypothetical protein